MGLFDEPVKAHIGDDSVLWVGVVEAYSKVGETASTLSQAIVVNAMGRVGLAPIQELNADWRWVPDRGPYRPGTPGPGWVDLDEYESPRPAGEPVDLEAAKAAVVDALTSDSVRPTALVEGRDYVLGQDGTKFDPSTNLPIDE